MFYTGIDPGKQGAIAGIGPGRAVAFLQDMPLRGGWYDPTKIKWLLSLVDQVVGIEESHRFPKLTKGIGILWGIAMTEPSVKKVVMVFPTRWQREHGIKKADKNVSIEIARQLFPECGKELTLKRHHNRAEALLIAEFIRRKYCPT